MGTLAVRVAIFCNSLSCLNMYNIQNVLSTLHLRLDDLTNGNTLGRKGSCCIATWVFCSLGLCPRTDLLHCCRGRSRGARRRCRHRRVTSRVALRACFRPLSPIDHVATPQRVQAPPTFYVSGCSSPQPPNRLHARFRGSKIIAGNTSTCSSRFASSPSLSLSP